MRIQLSDHFTYKRLFHFVIAPILMMICNSLYSIVDGIFVSNFVGKTPFAAVNLIMPIIMGVSSIGFMIGTGGSALVAKTMGEGQREKANQYFSMLICSAAILGLFFSALGFLFIRPIAGALGAEGELLDDCMLYGRILFLSETAFILQNAFQSFFSAAEKPSMSLKVSISAGLTNVILDFLFIVVFQWGLAGAAAATAIGQLVGGIVPVLYFIRKNSSLLKLGKTTFSKWAFFKSCANGSSEMVSTLSASIVSTLYNLQLMKLAGENGVAAYGVIMYVNFIFMAIYLGYSIGSTPISAYHYGAGGYDELKNMFKKSLTIMSCAGIVLTFLAELLAAPLVRIFAGYDTELMEMTCHGFRLYILSFVVMGINIWGSSFFTALGNGAISAAISFLRSLVFEVACVLCLPLILGINGIWLSIVVAELIALIITCIFFAARKNTYHYL